MNKIIKLLLVSLFFAAFFPLSAAAASTLYLDPASGSYIEGSIFPVSVYVNTGGDSINAADGSITFDSSKFFVSSIDVSQSAFTTWAQYPSFSNSAGTINFAGGVPTPGINGAKLIFTINFKGVNTGNAAVSFAIGGSVLLNDGLGTNVLSQVNGGSYKILPVPPSVPCFASPNSSLVGQKITFKANPSGGDGNYTYVWSGDCSGTSPDCSSSYNTQGIKTATVTVSSNGQSAASSCSANVSSPGSGLGVACSSTADTSEDFADVGQQVTFLANAYGGDGNYTYAWSGDCSGTSPDCSSSYNIQGIKTATVTVSSNGKSSSANCLLAVCKGCSASPVATPISTSAPITNQIGVSGGQAIAFQINDIILSNITDNSADVSWLTSQPAKCQFFWGETSDYSGKTISETVFLSGHSVELKNLKPSSPYHLKISCVDASQEKYQTQDQQFNTLISSANNQQTSVVGTGNAQFTAKYQFTKNLHLGDNNYDVKQLQVFLNTQGFVIANSGPGSPGHETTRFGMLTKQALIKYQDANFDGILKPAGFKKGTGVFSKYTMQFVNNFLLNEK